MEKGSSAPRLKGTGEGWWRTRMAGGQDGSAPPRSSPCSGLQQTPGQEGKRPSVQDTNISCASRGIPAWQWAQLTRGGGSCAAARTALLGTGLSTQSVTTASIFCSVLFFFFFPRTDIRYIERFSSIKSASNAEVCESASEKKVSLVYTRPHYMKLFPHGFYRELSLPENFRSEKVNIMSGWIKSRRREVFLLCRDG